MSVDIRKQYKISQIIVSENTMNNVRNDLIVCSECCDELPSHYAECSRYEHLHREKDHVKGSDFYAKFDDVLLGDFINDDFFN
mgnify:CR=1 FL=1